MSQAAASKTPNRVKRVRRTPEEARRLILEAAQERIAKTGPEGLRLQDIAADLGISHPSILHHFGSRAGLVRALTRQAVAELKEKLLAATKGAETALEPQLHQVFDAFRNGLAQRMAWLATVDPGGSEAGSAMVLREIADTMHARRLAAAPPGARIERSDTEHVIHLVAVAAFGDAIFGAQLRHSAGVPADDEADRRFRLWLAALVSQHLTQR
jgi:TetR/AcrR family transcriptional regulator, repressor for neighboring sulfatase